MHELALFAGSGGGLLGSRILGWNTVCAVEIDQYCRTQLLARQRDGVLDRFPIWDDIRTFDGRPWRGAVDVVSGGFPCQDISSAGKRAGLAGDRSGLWYEMLRVVGEVQPAFVFAENSPCLRTRGLGTVIKGLAGLGYDCRWCVLGARDVGAPHIRKRMWILAHSDGSRKRAEPVNAEVAGTSKYDGWFVTYPNSNALWVKSRWRGRERRQAETIARKTDWWPVDSISGMDYGVANRVDRIRATGNGQVPRVAALAWRVLSSGLRLP